MHDRFSLTYFAARAYNKRAQLLLCILDTGLNTYQYHLIMDLSYLNNKNLISDFQPLRADQVLRKNLSNNTFINNKKNTTKLDPRSHQDIAMENIQSFQLVVVLSSF